MAKIQYSALVTQMKGKMRGAIFQSGTAGQIVRSAKNFNRTASPRWQKQKNRLSTVSRAWNTLTEAERATWAAIAVNFPLVNNFGETRIPDGYTVFSKLNATILGAGGTIMSAPTMPVQLTDCSSAGALFSTPSSIQFDSGNIITSSELMLVNASAPILPSRKNPPTGFKRVGNYYNPFSVIYDITADYVGIFGAPPVNSKIVLQLHVFNAYTGQKSNNYIVTLPIV